MRFGDPHNSESRYRVTVRWYKSFDYSKTSFEIGQSIYSLANIALRGRDGFWLTRDGVLCTFPISEHCVTDAVKALYTTIKEFTAEFLRGRLSLSDLQNTVDLCVAIIGLLFRHDYFSENQCDCCWTEICELLRRGGVDIDIEGVPTEHENVGG